MRGSIGTGRASKAHDEQSHAGASSCHQRPRDADAHPLELTDEGLRIRRDGATGNGGDTEVVAAEVVVVSGTERRPHVDKLGLDLLRMRQHDAGFILVDERQRSSVAGIYAVGDVTPGAAWAHRAYRQGKVAAEVIAGRPAAFDAVAVPAVVLAEPHLASVGLGEDAARVAGYDPMVARFPWAASGRALTLSAGSGQGAGQTVVVSDRANGVLLGAHIAGPDAGELIGEAALALEMGATLDDIALTIHPHPTLSEGRGAGRGVRAGLGPAHAHAAGPVSADVDDNEGDGAMRRPPRCHPRPIT